MKRSEINSLMKEATEIFAEYRYLLPPWAYWRPSDWKGRGEEISEIRENMMGWDVTDFGSGNFEKRGLFLFTVRNGNPKRDKKPYAEKIMIVKVNQETPMHFHYSKMEDIINRGGGKLVIQLYNATKDDKLADSPIQVSVDGIRRTIQAGGKIVLGQGESICLEQRCYHSFWAEGAPVLTGEVSMANDDVQDNRFLDNCGRFPAIEEDTEALHLLVSDYAGLGGKS